MENPRTILVIKPSSLGDVVHTLPAVACVKRQWPGAKLSWLVNPEWAPILKGNPHVDEILEFPRAKFRGLAGILRFFKWARKIPSHDLVLDFQGLFRSAYAARCAGRNSRGTSDSREGARLLHRNVVSVPPRSTAFHAVRRYLSLVAGLGCAVPDSLEWNLPSEPLPDGVPEAPIVIHPFSRGEGKSLTVGQLSAFFQALAPHPVVVAGRSDEIIPQASHVTNLLNKTSLPQLCELLRCARFVVSVDSGPMHIAAAVNSRLLSIHTWSDPRKVGPYPPSAWVWKDGIVSRVANFPDGVCCAMEEIPRWVAGCLSAGG